MHVPDHFAAADPSALLVALVATSLPHLVTVTADGPVSTPVPMLYDENGDGEHGSLVGHLARANPQWSTASAGVDALVIVLGPDAYVSPNWYPSKVEHGRVVPTWNYEAVHAYGPLVVHDDLAWKLQLVRRLTDTHEAGEPRPWSTDDPPAGYVEKQLAAVVGFEIPVNRLLAKRKLSQNRPAGDTQGATKALAIGRERAQAVSAAMARP